MLRLMGLMGLAPDNGVYRHHVGSLEILTYMT